MSDGPIKKWWESHTPERVSTPDLKRACFPVQGRGYCGRALKGQPVADWKQVTCADCHAARRADEREAQR